MQTFTMADIVATVLWHHSFETLEAFLDVRQKAKFRFIRKESDSKKRNFVIERNSRSSVFVSERIPFPRLLN